MVKKEIELSGKKLAFHKGGAGPALILLHGFGEDGGVWHHQIESLEQRSTLIIPELPGTGASAPLDQMTMEGMAETIKELLDKEKIETCTIIGHSMGGYITLAFAEKYSNYLKGFGLFHSTAFADTEEKKITRQKGIEFIHEHGAAEFLKNTIPGLFSRQTRDDNPGIIDKQIISASNFKPEALVSYYEGMIRRTDKTMVLRNSTIPVLFVAGSSDTAVPIEDVLKQCHLPSLSYIHTLDQSGHMGMLEEPGKTNLILEEFLRFISRV